MRKRLLRLRGVITQAKEETTSLNLAEPQLDLDKGIKDNWQLEEKAGPEEHEIEDLLSGLDKFDEQEYPDLQGDISRLLFGDNPEDGLAAYEKTAEERRLDSWEQNAFDPEQIQQEQDHPDQELERALGDQAQYVENDPSVPEDRIVVFMPKTDPVPEPQPEQLDTDEEDEGITFV